MLLVSRDKLLFLIINAIRAYLDEYINKSTGGVEAAGQKVVRLSVWCNNF